jgi:chaperonin GroEL (HSP60 family)
MQCQKKVAGGGAVESALSIYLDDFAKSLGTREQVRFASLDSFCSVFVLSI